MGAGNQQRRFRRYVQQSGGQGLRALRADAQRNRARMLAAATAVIAESGPHSPLDES